MEARNSGVQAAGRKFQFAQHWKYQIYLSRMQNARQKYPKYAIQCAKARAITQAVESVAADK